ncbi:hypothetical protein O181_035913 [Austropuccinia psidii MF-1]|uniref:Uncharacterized protein n=1 Tax=Austropuccinia psidii MF-1 TaxID=1389203 RepID=A0A9Q3D8F7_9BASI|nr:hypothetical protein [Austropuccinia psidii MF-1]
MICLVLALNLDLKMSSKLTSICDSDHSDSLPSVLYGSGVFDNLRELSEESMAPTEIWDINKTYNGFKSVRVIEPPCINFQRKGVPCVEYATATSTRQSQKIMEQYQEGWKIWVGSSYGEPPTSDATSGHSNLTGSRMRGVQQWNNTSSSWANIGGSIHPKGNPIGVAPEVPILVTRKDVKLGKMKRNLVVQDEIDTDSEGSDEIDG